MQQIVLYALLGAFFNAFIRGGLIKKWLPSFRGSKIINAIAFGVAAYFAANNPIYAACMALGMLAGQAPAIFHEASDVAIRQRAFLMWLLVVAERGMVWGVCLALASAYHFQLNALWWLLLALAMPLCYIPSYYQLRNNWPYCEAAFGFVMWCGLLLVK